MLAYCVAPDMVLCRTEFQTTLLWNTLKETISLGIRSLYFSSTLLYHSPDSTALTVIMDVTSTYYEPYVRARYGHVLFRKTYYNLFLGTSTPLPKNVSLQHDFLDDS